MTFERFEQYVKTIGVMVVVAHLFVTRLVFDLILRHPNLADHPFPVALPISFAAGLYGWWIVYKSPLPPRYRTVVSECPCCHQRVTKKVLVENLDKPVEAG